MTESQRPRKNPEYEVQVLGEELLLYSPRTESIVQANPTAALIWNLCDGDRTIDDILHMLREAYPENAAQIARDVHLAIEELARIGAVLFEASPAQTSKR